LDTAFYNSCIIISYYPEDHPFAFQVLILGHLETVKSRPTNTLCKYMIVVGKSEEKNLTSSYSSKKDSREEVEKEREEAKIRILEENPNISKDALEFMLSLPI
jgi:hypothetical protein